MTEDVVRETRDNVGGIPGSRASSPRLSEGSVAERLFATMSLIRFFEERVLQLFSQGRLAGTTHTYLGQEAIAASVAAHLHEDDVVFAPHRCHGHFLARGGAPEALLAEMMGREGGVCGGRGGSQHLHAHNFYSSGVQGGIVGNAAGVALAQSLGARPGITVVFLGDGTLGEGLVYETLNFAALRRLPLLFVLEDNQYAQTTPRDMAVSGSMTARAAAFGIASHETDDRDPMALYGLLGERIRDVRRNRAPFFQVIHTYRAGPHSKGDDFRPPAELEQWLKTDPLARLRGQLDAAHAQEISEEARRGVEEALRLAEASPETRPELATASTVPVEFDTVSAPWPRVGEIFIHALNRGMRELMARRSDVVFIGQDLLDPYGGAFAASKGLSTQFPDRVISTPISEAGIVAWGTGAALAGMRPVLEIMFGDFILLAADQIVNHATKYPWVSRGEAAVPLVIRTPMGAGRGYGPTHSQTLEGMFLGTPGLQIVAASALLDPGELLRRAVESDCGPVLFIEPKRAYSRPLETIADGKCGAFRLRASKTEWPTVHLSLADFSAPDAVLFAYGGMAPAAMKAAEVLLMEHEVLADVVVPSLLSPTPAAELAACARDARLLVTIEENHACGGWGAEVAAAVNEAGGAPRRCLRIAPTPTPVPAAPALEGAWLPSVDRIVAEVAAAAPRGSSR